MAKLPGLAMLILAALASVSSAQDPCRGCANNEKKQQAVLEEERKAGTTKTDIWAKTPPIRIIPSASNAKYAKFKARFVVTNDSNKKIKEVVWVCEFTDPVSKAAISNNTITSRKRIAPHTDGVLTEKVFIPLDRFLGLKVVSANQPTKKPKIPDVVQMEQTNTIKEIRYADGSVSRP